MAEETKRITKEYELLLEENLGLEKLSRAKRFKAETQLQNWVIKYDQDIGERQAEYETFKARFVIVNLENLSFVVTSIGDNKLNNTWKFS